VCETMDRYDLSFIDANVEHCLDDVILPQMLDIVTSTDHRIVQQPDRYVVVFFDFS